MLPPFIPSPDEGGTLVAFGQLVSDGITSPVSITGGAACYLWGLWAPGLNLIIERSTDNGATWTTSMTFPPDGSFSYQFATMRALSSAAVSGASLYRFNLAAPFPGGVVNWAVFQ